MWKSRLFWRIAGAYSLLSILLAVAFVQTIHQHQRQTILSLVEQRLLDSARLLEASPRSYLAASPGPELQTELARLEHVTGVRLTLIAADGLVLGDSQTSPDSMENHIYREEVIEARSQGVGASERDSPTQGVSTVYVAVRVGEPHQVQGYIRAAVPGEVVDSEARFSRWVMWIFAFAVGGISLLITYMLLVHIIRPLETLTLSAEAFGQGNLQKEVQLDSSEEFGTLAKAFNTMSRSLSQRITELDTQRRELEEKKALLETVLGTMIEGVVAVDDDQRILFANRAARPLMDMEARNVIGRRIWESSRLPKVHQSIRQVLRTNEAARVQIENPRSGSIVDLRITRLPATAGNGTMLVMHDITELRKLENMRRDFVTNVSHELKTPLASVQAYTETLLNGAVDEPEVNRHFLKRIESEADRLHTLVLDLLNLSRLESSHSTFELEPVPVAETVHQCLESRSAVAHSQQVSLSTDSRDESLNVWCDQEGLRAILDNLVDNAIKYTPAGGSVRINWTASPEEVCLEVTDTGIGIPPEHQARVFERFYRVDKARSREMGGTGLGLSIVKHWVQLFKGRIQLASQQGKGTTFRVWLPRRPVKIA